MNQASKRFVAVAGLIMGLAGCYSLGQGSNSDTSRLDPKDKVARLANERWDALIQGDLAKAYEFLSPGYRSIESLDVYKAKIRVGGWKKATVKSVSCDSDMCKVILTIEHGYRDMKAIDTVLSENWLQEGGRWWYVPNK